MNHALNLRRTLTSRPLTAAELRTRLGVSAPTLSRLIRELPEVIRFGRARATKYAWPRVIAGCNRRDFPMVETDAAGHRMDFGKLVPIEGGFLHLRPDDNADFHEGLPWFLRDLVPQGYLGRAFAQACNRGDEVELPHPVPPNPDDWSDDLRLVALNSKHWSPPGNLSVGDAKSAVDFFRTAEPCDFPLFAQATMRGEAHGSSAGGEQPKFDTMLADGPEPYEALVKFSWGESTESKRRRADLLIAEHLAGRALARTGLPVVRSHLETVNDTVFLVVRREDRIGPHGRRGFVSLGALDDEHVGERRSWTHSTTALAKAGVISRDDAVAVRRAEGFARLIANNDRHPGNIAFFREGLSVRGLFPIYDMLPMRFAPAREGRIESEPPSREELTRDTASEDLQEMIPIAREFWESVAGHPGVSASFRELSGRMTGLVSGILP